MKKFNLLLTGESSPEMKTVEAFVRGLENYDVKLAYAAGDAPFLWPMKLATDFADVVIVNLGRNWDAVLAKIPSSTNEQSKVIVFGPENNMPVVRQAMKIGAEDYLSFPVENEELLAIISQHRSNKLKLRNSAGKNNIMAVIGSRGGVGSSFLATNIAHVCAGEKKLHTALLDFDLQYGVQAMNLDIKPTHYLKEVVTAVQELDGIAMKGYFARHESGIFYLGESVEDMPVESDYINENLEKVLEHCGSLFEETVIDLPRHIDSVFSSVVEKTQKFVLVCQQSIVHVRDTKRIYDILVDEFSVPKDNIFVVANRYNENYTINLARIQETLGSNNVVPLANDFKRVSMSLDAAVPINQKAENAVISKQISQLVNLIRNEEEVKNSFLKRAFKGIFK